MVSVALGYSLLSSHSLRRSFLSSACVSHAFSFMASLKCLFNDKIFMLLATILFILIYYYCDTGEAFIRGLKRGKRFSHLSCSPLLLAVEVAIRKSHLLQKKQPRRSPPAFLRTYCILRLIYYLMAIF